MLFNVSLDSTWRRKKNRNHSPAQQFHQSCEEETEGCNGTEPSVPFSCSVLFLVEKELCHSAKTSRTTSIWRQKWRDIFQWMTRFPGSQSSFTFWHREVLKWEILRSSLTLKQLFSPVSKQWWRCWRSVLNALFCRHQIRNEDTNYFKKWFLVWFLSFFAKDLFFLCPTLFGNWVAVRVCWWAIQVCDSFQGQRSKSGPYPIIPWGYQPPVCWYKPDLLAANFWH